MIPLVDIIVKNVTLEQSIEGGVVTITDEKLFDELMSVFDTRL